METPEQNSTQPLLQRKVDFHLARKPVSYSPNINPNFKLETLNPPSNNFTLNLCSQPSSSSSSSSSFNSRKGIDQSDFFEDAVLAYCMPLRRIGAGLRNLGNTCFLNSVLQCLTYTEPLVGYLESGKHQATCRVAGFCALCALHKHVSRALKAPGKILSPNDLVSNLRCISRNFRNARQEDAHEYMIHLLESMHKCCLPSGVPAESPGAYEKSLVHRIFGGRLRSQVKCLQCSHCSNTFDPFLDLSLEIAKADSLYKALRHFTAPEQIDGGERVYKCERCKQKVRALKQLTISRAPYVLAVHLKRFRSHNSGQKIDRKVQFGSTLDLKPFVTGDYEGDLTYTLYGVLVHAGWSTHAGHYFSFVRTSSGLWFSLDDNTVRQVSEKIVMEQKAYVLFYVRDRKNFITKKALNVMQKENLIRSMQNAPSSRPMPVVNSTSNVNATAATSAASVAKHLEKSEPSEVLGQPILSRSLTQELDQPMSVKSSVSKSESSLFSKGDIDRIVKSATTSAEDSHIQNGSSSAIKKIPESDPLVLVDKPSQVDCPSTVTNGVGCKASDMDVTSTPAVASDPIIQHAVVSVPCNSLKVSKSNSRRPHMNGAASHGRLRKKGSMKNILKSRTVGMHLSTRMLYGAAFLNLKKRKRKCKQMKEQKTVGLCDNLPAGEVSTSASVSVASGSCCCVGSISGPCKIVNKSCLEEGEKDGAKNLVINSDSSLPVVTSDEVHENRSQPSQMVFDSDKQLQKTSTLETHSQHIGVFHPEYQSSQPHDSLEKIIVGCWGGKQSLSEDAKENGSEVIIGHVEDEWGVEYDRGKRKKVRGPKDTFDGPNVFQEVATKRAKLMAKSPKTVKRNSVNEPFRI